MRRGNEMRRILIFALLLLTALMPGYSGKSPATSTGREGTIDEEEKTTRLIIEKGMPSALAFGLKDDIVSLPIYLSHEFPLVAVKINGVPGKLMFDTGSEEALSLNDKAVPLQGGRVIGEGVMGSGQKFEIKSYPVVSSVVLDGSIMNLYQNLHNVKGQDLSFMTEGVGDDFLGILGHHFYDGYLFKLDYCGNRVTFYRQTEERMAAQDFLKDETIIAVLPFEIRKLPNHPMVPLTIGEVPFLGSFDTGQLGGIYLDKATRAKFTKQRLLTPKVGGDEPMFDLSGIAFMPAFTASVSGTRVFDSPLPTATALGITERNVISFGYSFLRRYKTVWDFGECKIYFLKP
jgi:hypothetical protein